MPLACIYLARPCPPHKLRSCGAARAALQGWLKQCGTHTCDSVPALAITPHRQGRQGRRHSHMKRAVMRLLDSTLGSMVLRGYTIWFGFGAAGPARSSVATYRPLSIALWHSSAQHRDGARDGQGSTPWQPPWIARERRACHRWLHPMHCNKDDGVVWAV